MPIKNLSNIRRLPRLGKIHLGIKVKNEKGTEYPKEVDYFVVPEKVEEAYGKEPKDLKIMFPVENSDVFFQQWYKSYGYNLLKCKGDGQVALTWDEEKGGMKETSCPCEKLEKGECRRIGILQFLLPDVAGAGVWQISTSSRNSIIDINSSIDYIRALCGRIRMIPLILKRVETKIQRVENGKPKTGKHFTLQIDVDNISLRQLQQAAQIAPEKVLLPPPEESKDELFYPPNGFKPEEEAEKPEEPKKEKEAEKVEGKDELRISLLKPELHIALSEFRERGGKTKPKEEERLDALEVEGTADDYEVAIDYYKGKTKKLKEKEEEEKSKPTGSQGDIPF